MQASGQIEGRATFPRKDPLYLGPRSDLDISETSPGATHPPVQQVPGQSLE